MCGQVGLLMHLHPPENSVSLFFYYCSKLNPFMTEHWFISIQPGIFRRVKHIFKKFSLASNQCHVARKCLGDVGLVRHIWAPSCNKAGVPIVAFWMISQFTPELG